MERLGDNARRLLSTAGPAAAGEAVDVAQVWPDVVGPGVAAAAWPNRVGRDGTLHVATVSSVWAFELGRMQAEILERLRARLPDLATTSIRFAVGPVPAPAADPGEGQQAAVQPSAEDRDQAVAAAAAIEDEELRETVARAVAASLARNRSDRCF